MNENELTNDVDRIISKLCNALEIENPEGSTTNKNLEPILSCALDLPEEQLKNLALDLSLLAASSGDWHLALKFFLKIQNHSSEFAKQTLKLWQLRCLVEIENYSDALAIVRANRWDEEMQIHVNFLAGLAFEALEMRNEAQTRFDAVHRKNPNYRDIAQRILKA